MTYYNTNNPNNNPKPKLVAISTAGTYTVRVCKIRDEDVSATQKGDAKIKVLMTTKDGLKINDTFYGSTDGALKRAAAFVNVATGKKLPLPPREAAGLKAYLDQATGYWITVQIAKEPVTFSNGETKEICKITKFNTAVQPTPAQASPSAPSLEAPPF